MTRRVIAVLPLAFVSWRVPTAFAFSADGPRSETTAEGSRLKANGVVLRR